MQKRIKFKKIKDSNILSKRSKGEKVLFSIVFIIFCIQSATMIFALGWLLVNSLKGVLEYAGGNSMGLPEKLLFKNYKLAFELLNVSNTTFAGMVFNSIWYTLIGTVISAFVPSITGYIFSKYNFKGKKFIFSLAILSMTLPVVGTLASYMKLIYRLNLYDSPLFVIVANLGAFGGNFLIYYAFYKGVSWSYAEAGKMDGATPFQVFTYIMLPLAKSIIFTYMVINFIGFWNEYNNIILYLPSYPTLAVGLFEFKSNANRMSNYPVYFAGLIISMIPTLILFVAFSNRIMTSLSVGGLKG